MDTVTVARCHWCDSDHGTDHLCPAAKQVLDRLHQQAQDSVAPPTMEFTNEDDVPMDGLLCKAFAVRAFYTLTLGVHRPGIAIDPVLLDDNHLRPLILIDEPVALRRAGRLFDDMTALAVRRARKARDQAFKYRSV